LADEGDWQDSEDDDDDDDDDDEEADWEKVGEEEEKDEQWVKLEEQAPEPVEVPDIPSLKLRTVGLATAGAGGLLLVRGVLLRAELKSMVVDVGDASNGAWSDDITALQQRTNTHLMAGWVGLGAGTAMAAMAPTGSASMSLTWSGRW